MKTSKVLRFLFLFIPGFLWAQGVSVSTGVSTFGFTVTPEVELSRSFGARALLGQLTVEQDFQSSKYNFAAQGKAGGAAVLFDYYPLKGGLRFSGGIAKPQYQFKTNGVAKISLYGDQYTVNDVRGTLSIEKAVPMIGLGYKFGRGVNSRVYGSVDLGALLDVEYQSSYRYDDLPQNLNAQQERLIREAVDKDVKDIMSELSENGQILPFLSVSIGFDF